MPQPILADLIDLPRLQQHSALRSAPATDATYLATLITTASGLVRDYCHRSFTAATYTEYYDGQIYKRNCPLRLRQYPVLSINRVASYPRPAIQIINNDNANNSRATVQTLVTPSQPGQCSDVQLNTQRGRNALSTSVTQLVSASPAYLISDVLTAINGYGNGWSAVIQPNSYGGDFSNWLMSDLRVIQGAFSALINGGAYLEIFTEDISGIGGWPSSEGYADDDYAFWTGRSVGWRCEDETGEVWGRLPRGKSNVRIDYTAGYATIPQQVQEATVQIVANIYNQRNLNKNLKSASVGSFFSYTVGDPTVFSADVRQALSRFVDHSKVVAR